MEIVTTRKATIVKRIAVTLALLATTIAAGPIDQLDRFAGTWQTQGTFLDTPYSKAGSASGLARCAWSSDRLFMICQQTVTLNGKTDHDVTIYAYDDAAQQYTFHNVHAANATTATITIDGDTVTYPFSYKDGDTTVSIRTLNIWKNPYAYAWRTEYSTDGGTTWTPMASGTSTKAI
jgi:hypothetical protein